MINTIRKHLRKLALAGTIAASAVAVTACLPNPTDARCEVHPSSSGSATYVWTTCHNLQSNNWRQRSSLYCPGRGYLFGSWTNGNGRLSISPACFGASSSHQAVVAFDLDHPSY